MNPSAKKAQISSLRELQRLMPRLLKETAGNDRLLLAAAANPILALAQLGYEVAPEAAREIELRARFGEEEGAAYDALEKEIRALAGDAFNPEDRRVAQQVLERLLPRQESGKGKGKKQQEPTMNGGRRKQILEAAKPLAARRVGETAVKDPLTPFAESHPVIPLLLRWREMERRAPRFAPADLFQRILDEEVDLPITDIEFKLQERSRRKAS